MRLGKEQNRSFLDSLNFCVAFSQEKISENGEDSYDYSINEIGALAAVYDGCGGAGAKRYERLQNKSGAYIASRAVGCAAKKWFLESCNSAECVFSPEKLKQEIVECLNICASYDTGAGMKLRGSMAKDFPSTLVAIACTMQTDKICADVFWAGDSRAYLLNEDGIFLLTKDDLAAVDLYEDYSCDGVMSNVISHSKAFDIHQMNIVLEKPGVLIAATDGCFGYFSTPMEFEFAVIETMLKSSGPEELENALKELLGHYASDDYTWSSLGFGFDSFEQMKNCFVPRANHLYENYIAGLSGCSDEDKRLLWNGYRDHFLRYLSISDNRLA